MYQCFIQEKNKKNIFLSRSLIFIMNWLLFFLFLWMKIKQIFVLYFFTILIFPHSTSWMNLISSYIELIYILNYLWIVVSFIDFHWDGLVGLNCIYMLERVFSFIIKFVWKITNTCLLWLIKLCFFSWIFWDVLAF